jgi:hypothetical protein
LLLTILIASCWILSYRRELILWYFDGIIKNYIID